MVSSLSCVTVLFTLGGMGTAIPLGDFYSFGATANDSFLLPNDDGSSLQIFLNRPLIPILWQQTHQFICVTELMHFSEIMELAN